MKILQSLMAVALLSSIAYGQTLSIPQQYAPQEIARGVANEVSRRSVDGTKVVVYMEICAWYGALKYAEAAHDTEALAALQKRFDDLLKVGNGVRVPDRRHVDFDIFGVVPLELYRQTGDKKYRDMGLHFADIQWENQQPDGLSSETRYWIDDMYMLPILQLEAYRVTQNPKYLDRTAAEMAVYLTKLQQPNGLFYHAPDVPFYWGRGNGWMAAGMTEVLTSLPKSNPHYAEILAGYRKMMAALLATQRKDGTWLQLLDHEESWSESSASGMFTFAFAEGVRNGWLDKEIYGPATYRAWIGVAGFVDQQSEVTSVCEGTDKKNSLEYYLLRRRRTGDWHGQAAILWAATAMMKLSQGSGTAAIVR
jgi:unsaturated rhamnogalacturonyl hydrolase